eukprot:6432822-Ditylum_brightwellii.AAC.1
MAFENTGGVHSLQSDPTYNACMQEDMNIHQFVDWVNKLNKHLMLFLSKDDGSSQDKLPKDKILDILEALMSQKWQAEMMHQRFGVIADGQ